METAANTKFRLFSTKNVAFGIIAIFIIFISLYYITGLVVAREVEENCAKAQNGYEGDCVEALTQKLMDEDQPYRERNSAIWTLGQIGDPKALPVLEKYYTGIIPDREPLDGAISQHELKKAIKLAKGGLNITHIIR